MAPRAFVRAGVRCLLGILACNTTASGGPGTPQPMAPGDLASLLDRAQIDPASFYPRTGGLLGSDHDFWDPHHAPALRTAQAKRPEARALNLGIDDSPPGLVVVYLVEHGT